MSHPIKIHPRFLDALKQRFRPLRYAPGETTLEQVAYSAGQQSVIQYILDELREEQED